MVDSVKKPDGVVKPEPVVGTDGASLMGGTMKSVREKELFGATKGEWDDANKPQAWNATPGGRLAIRTFSRGVLGAVFFTAGGKWARKMMMYDNEYNRDMHWGELLNKENKASYLNPFHAVTKSIDTFIGKPIEVAATIYHGGDAMKGMRAVHFKPTKYSKTYGGEKYLGRSLGEEMMFVTFDFFCASIGDALGRDLIGWFDPGQKKEWLDEKGWIKFPEAVKTLTTSLFRYVTYNGGEDWAVALPYVYFMRAQKGCIDKYITPGYRYESDIAHNASSLKIQTSASPNLVNGSFSLEAILDYQSRFTVYNIGTLMYREVYDKWEQWFKHGKDVKLYGAPDAPTDPNRSVLGVALDTVKWMLRSFIKGGLYMTPAVPLFSLTRATQSRSRGLFIRPGNGTEPAAALSFRDQADNPHYVTVGHGTTGEHGFTPDTPVYWGVYDPSDRGGRGAIVEAQSAAAPDNPFKRSKITGYELRNNVAENGLSMIGKANKWASELLDKRAEGLEKTGIGKALKKVLGLTSGGKAGNESLAGFTQSAIKASISYTPYMYAKGEMANFWDRGSVDYGLETAIDGLFAGDFNKFRMGVSDTWDGLLHRPINNEERNTEARRRDRIDTSAADDADPEYWRRRYEYDEQAAKSPDIKKAGEDFTKEIDVAAAKHNMKPTVQPDRNSGLPWSDRTVTGRRDPHEEELVSTVHTPTSHAEQVEMERFLKESQSPSKSIN